MNQIEIPARIQFDEIASQHADQVGADKEKVVIDQDRDGCFGNADSGNLIEDHQAPRAQRGPDELGPHECVTEHKRQNQSGIVGIVDRRWGDEYHGDNAASADHNQPTENRLDHFLN